MSALTGVVWCFTASMSDRVDVLEVQRQKDELYKEVRPSNSVSVVLCTGTPEWPRTCNLSPAFLNLRHSYALSYLMCCFECSGHWSAVLSLTLLALPCWHVSLTIPPAIDQP